MVWYCFDGNKKYIMGKQEQDYHAYFIEINGMTTLVDPVGFALVKAVNKINCESTYLSQLDKINHFKNRIIEKGLDPKTFAINIINVDAPYGFEFAEILIQGHDWQQYRDQGKIPLARGFETKDFMIKLIAVIDKEAADKINQVEGIPVIVVDYGVIEIFSI